MVSPTNSPSRLSNEGEHKDKKCVGDISPEMRSLDIHQTIKNPPESTLGIYLFLAKFQNGRHQGM